MRDNLVAILARFDIAKERIRLNPIEASLFDFNSPARLVQPSLYEFSASALSASNLVPHPANNQISIAVDGWRGGCFDK